MICFSVIDRCNWDCDYCIAGTQRRYNKNKPALTEERFKKIIIPQTRLLKGAESEKQNEQELTLKAKYYDQKIVFCFGFDSWIVI